jgi:hypothetical protein
MGTALRFPVFVIAGRDGVVVVNTCGKDCILLFHWRELAKKQIDKLQASLRWPRNGGFRRRTNYAACAGAYSASYWLGDRYPSVW